MESFVNHLGLFAKYWQPGQVKTRLAATIGDDLACRLYRIFLFNLLDRLGISADSRWVVFSPAEQQDSFRSEIAESWQLQAQSDGSLGRRMEHFFDDRFSQCNQGRVAVGRGGQTQSIDCHKTIVIGADCPQITAREIADAFERLEGNDVVIGPSADGGYYLLGMRSQRANVFENVDWSTDRVLPQTIRLLEQQGKSYALLDVKTDVDDAKNLIELMQWLEANSGQAYAQGLLEQIHGVLPESWSDGA